MTPPALEELDLTAALAAFRDQSETHGHTAERDAELRICHFADTARRLAAELADVLLPGDRQSLPVAYRRAARLAAFTLATMRRIRLEQGPACNTPPTS
jgi:hypothetical protein